MPETIERILIANDARGVPTILATDGAHTALLCDEQGTGAADLGIDVPKEPGLYLFVGYPKYEAGNYEYPNELDLYWYGDIRPVKPEEVEALFQMSPPDPDEDRP